MQMPISLMCNSAVICGFLVKATDLHSDSGNKVCFLIFAVLCDLETNCIYDEYNCYFSWFKIHLLQDYPLHLASSVCEWTVAFSFVCFFLTYINDFKVSITTSNREVNSFFFRGWKIFFVSPFLFPTAVYLAGEDRVRGVIWISHEQKLHQCIFRF